MGPLSTVVLAVVGAVVVAGTLMSAIRTLILPRSARSVITSVLFEISGRIFALLAGKTYERRDRVLALFAPVTLVALAGVWLALIVAGYTFLFRAAGFGTWPESLWAAGSSALTLGTVPMGATGHRLLAISAAALGLGLIALLIAFLPSLYADFSRREELVALLEVRAGQPPSAVEMLLRFHRIGWSTSLSEEWGRWEEWFNHIDESHTTHPSLVMLRSPRPDRSWITAAGTVLDAASLWMAAIAAPPDPMAQLCIRAGYVALRRIADFFAIPYDPDPSRGDPISISRDEFEDVVERLRDEGLPVRGDLDEAWLDFAGWRVNYDVPLLRLSELVVAPYAPWTADRSAPDHAPARAPRWGRTG